MLTQSTLLTVLAIILTLLLSSCSIDSKNERRAAEVNKRANGFLLDFGAQPTFFRPNPSSKFKCNTDGNTGETKCLLLKISSPGEYSPDITIENEEDLADDALQQFCRFPSEIGDKIEGWTATFSKEENEKYKTCDGMDSGFSYRQNVTFDAFENHCIADSDGKPKPLAVGAALLTQQKTMHWVTQTCVNCRETSIRVPRTSVSESCTDIDGGTLQCPTSLTVITPSQIQQPPLQFCPSSSSGSQYPGPQGSQFPGSGYATTTTMGSGYNYPGSSSYP